MDQIQALRAEVKRLTEQTASDFDFTMLAMKDMGERFQSQSEELGRQLAAQGREVNERFNQLAGRMKLQEQRVTAVLKAVDDSLAVYEDHERRLRALEAKDSAA